MPKKEDKSDLHSNVDDICNRVYPVSSVRVYRGGVCQTFRNGGISVGGGGARGQITYLSHRSRSKMLFTLAITEIVFKSMITLTYPDVYPTSGKRVKQDLNRLRQSYGRKFGKTMFWFLEFQARGAPHFHMFSCVDSPTRSNRENLAHMWARAIKADKGSEGKVLYVHSRRKAWDNFRSLDGSVRYAAKYALKTYQKVVPNDYRDVGRYWGCSQDVRDNTKPFSDYDIDDKTLSTILKSEGHVAKNWAYHPKYIFGINSLA